jgi:hypothetical protein
MNWLKELGEVNSPEALLAAVNEYLLAQPEEYWSCIPRESRPRLVASVEELHAWHQRLATTVGTATNPNIYLQDLCVFFMRASARAHALEQEARSANLANEGTFEASGNGG